MIKFKVNIIIGSRTETVAEALIKPSNFPCWETDLKRYVVVKGVPGEIGCVALLFFSKKGSSYMMEEELVHCNPGRSYVSILTGTTLEARVETILIPSGEETLMTFIWSGRGKTLLLKLLLPFMRGRMIRQTEVELDKFRKLVEAKGSDFNC
ncbi:MAG TPA: SRPBCC family protein [Spirochaetota bacterium]|nr:SRPBCC family protein [Spirochaetota bacterium]HPF06066.1 SRPBCC family protein [Spirochaetota bacterium]HPJ42380.1 SRPBCC family protein [Spirochaetota bacterium]HPR37301.1 SRPBCC family protein [Spirochaetota bacterium]HRX49111.1 SRPBCC family protein [Spirochaetota bacterium]